MKHIERLAGPLAWLSLLSCVCAAGPRPTSAPAAKGPQAQYGWIGTNNVRAAAMVAQAEKISAPLPEKFRLMHVCAGAAGTNPYEVWQCALSSAKPTVPVFHAADRVAVYVSPGVRGLKGVHQELPGTDKQAFEVSDVSLEAGPTNGPFGIVVTISPDPQAVPGEQLPYATLDLGRLAPGRYEIACRKLGERDESAWAKASFQVRPARSTVRPADLVGLTPREGTDAAPFDASNWRHVAMKEGEIVAAMHVGAAWGSYLAYRDGQQVTVQARRTDYKPHPELAGYWQAGPSYVQMAPDLWAMGLTGWELVRIKAEKAGPGLNITIAPPQADDGPANLPDTIEVLRADWSKEVAKLYPQGLPSGSLRKGEAPADAGPWAVRESLHATCRSDTKGVWVIFGLSAAYSGEDRRYMPPRPVLFVVYDLDKAGRLAGKSVIRPAEPAASQPARPAASQPAGGEWQKLFADESWYKSQEGAEQVFRGTLRAVPNAGGPSTLMRTSYYSLGDRTIYTGAKRLAALDALIGKDVEIRGKAVDMALEGQSLREIWPAAVRAAQGGGKEPQPVQPVPAGEVADPKRLAKADAVIRGRRLSITASPGARYRFETVAITEVLKKSADPGAPGLVSRVYVRVPVSQKGVPIQECTIYLVRQGGQWHLLGGGAAEGVSHVGTPKAGGEAPQPRL